MDKETRNRIQRATQAARALLEHEYAEQLEGIFDIRLDGTIAEEPGEHLDAAQRVLRTKLVTAVEHQRATGMNKADAVAAYLREAAFTTLNRFVALKMLEGRELVQECISRGDQSVGFKEFTGLAPGLVQLPDHGYRVFIEALFDELSLHVRVLFNRRDASSLLWPRRACLESLLAAVNGSELAGIWAQDETIGWIYQYYNDEAERKKMRKESSAPRDSRELAVRNQFFTPRYVVEFLTDNTLGRLWHEMTRGKTVLRERCRYLVRRPTEIFLKPGESAPDTAAESEGKAGEDLSQEELLRQPVHIPHRPLKDPREIRLLDPACGSMHFGLYAFDLFTVIYDEAWEIAHGPEAAAKSTESFAPFLTFAATFPDKTAFIREVPRLIVERNIHGIDIDPRATQIAGLSLWLRAQRAWQRAGVKPADRPRITRSNLACAEPMPGEKELLREFVEQLSPAGDRPALAFLLEKVFDCMALAGEAGSLLRIEKEIRTAIADAKKLWKQGPRHGQASLFAEPGEREGQGEMRLDLSGITDEQFWERAEQRIYDALEAYAEQAENGAGFQRRLFADDAAHGFAFIDLCTKRYDVAVMNPPFGDASLPSKSYIDETYGDTKGDVYKAFVECFHDRLVPAGYLGIISSRTGFFLGQSEDWRTRVVLRLFRPIALADLGMGVLDAMVEVAAYILRNLSEQEGRDLTLSLVPVLETVERDRQDRFSIPKWQAAGGGLKRHQAVAELERLEHHGFIQRCPGDIVRYTPLWHVVKKVSARPAPVFPPLICIPILAEDDKEEALQFAIREPAASSQRRRFDVNPKSFGSVPRSPFAYWAGESLRRVFTSFARFEADGRTAKQGLATGSDGRFLRLWWEVPPAQPLPRSGWVPLVKGGAPNIYYSDPYTSVNWFHDGAEVKAFASAYRASRGWGNQWSAMINSTEFYFQPGITWPLRASRFAPAVIPAGCAFSTRGCAALAEIDELKWLIGVFSARIFDALFKMLLGRFNHPEFTSGALQEMPIPLVSSDIREALVAGFHRGWATKRHFYTTVEDSHAFLKPALVQGEGNTLHERSASWAACVRTSEETGASVQSEIDDIAFRLYGLDAADGAALTSALAASTSGADAKTDDEEEETATADASGLTADLLAYALGSVFGRWDIRYATGERPVPELPDPFEQLPVCPPGMLQGDDGLPLSPEAGRQLRTEGRYPLDVAWDGILVDDREHPLDVERRIRGALAVLWGDRADALEHEACALLGVPTLRGWFRRPAGFFADHLKRYWKSRRKAPIYWPLSTASGSYTLWLYYHRFSKDTLYRALELVQEKLSYEERKLSRMTADVGSSPGAAVRGAVAELESLVAELRAFQAELTRVAPLWNPNLNDGVILNYGPLWRMIGHNPWQKAVKANWDEMVAGKYDWAHLAMHLWPERVVPKCATDRSLAIAHGLDDAFWDEDSSGQWQPRKVSQAEMDELIKERASAAVKDALESLLEAPTPASTRASRRKAPKAKGRRERAAARQNASANVAVSRARSSASAEADLVSKVRDAIFANADGASKADVIDATGITSGQWNTAIRTLLAEGSVTQTGERRGARYYLAGGEA